MHKIYLLIFLPLLILSCVSTDSTSNFKKESIFSIDGVEIPAEEFIYVYEKNNFNNDKIYTREDVLNYLDLFINFKLKVREARQEGIDTTKSFINEFESYKSELIKPYLLETKETDSMAWQAYQRMQYFIHASHILVNIDGDDTTRAYHKMTNIVEKLDEGWDFNQLAKLESEDPSAKQNNGDLGLFTAMRMVYPFENAAYNTPVGQVSEIFRTQFGYHILKVHEKVKNKGKIQIAHIVVNKANELNQDPEKKSFDIYDLLITGGDWDFLCKEYSEDGQTRDNGGVLNYFGQGQLPENFREFEKKIFELDSIGTIAGPIESPYGWHIVKLIGIKPPESFDELKESLKAQATRGERSQVKNEMVISRLKREAGFSQNNQVVNWLATLPNGEIAHRLSNSSIQDTTLNKKLFTIDQQNYNVKDFFVFQESRDNPQRRNPGNITDSYQVFVNEKLYAFEEERIAEEHIEYRMLVKEYFEGLLLFDIMEKYVWGKSVIDSVELADFYDSKISNYQWEERAHATIIHTHDQQIAEEINNLIASDEIIYFSNELTVDKIIEPRTLNTLITEIEGYLNDYINSTITIAGMSGKHVNSLTDSIKYQLEKRGISNVNFVLKEPITQNEEIEISLSSPSPGVVRYLYNKNSQLEVKIEEGLFEKKDQQIFSVVNWEIGSQTINDTTGITIVHIDEIIPPTEKKLSEIRGVVISDYQKELESRWIALLMEKYPVVKNENVIAKTIKYFEKK